MSVVTVYVCDAPSCLESDDESGDDCSLQEAGWLIVNVDVDEVQHVSHFHSYECLREWAEEACTETAGSEEA